MTNRDVTREWTATPPRGISQLTLIGRETCPNSIKSVQKRPSKEFVHSKEEFGQVIEHRHHHPIKVHARPWRLRERDRYGCLLSPDVRDLVTGGKLNWFRKRVFWRCWYCNMRVLVEKPKDAMLRGVPYDEAYGPWMHSFKYIKRMMSAPEADMLRRQEYVNAKPGDALPAVYDSEEQLLDLQFAKDDDRPVGPTPEMLGPQELVDWFDDPDGESEDWYGYPEDRGGVT